MRHLLATLALLLAGTTPLAAAEPTCLQARSDGGCLLQADPGSDDPFAYDVGSDAPRTGCDEEDDCCEGCFLEISTCLVDRVEPHPRARGGVGAPDARVALYLHEECSGVACWTDPDTGAQQCGQVQYGRGRVLWAGVVDTDRDGSGDTPVVNGQAVFIDGRRVGLPG